MSFTHPHDPYAIRAAYWNRYEDREIDLPRVSPLPPERMDAHSKRLRRVSAMDEVEISEADVRRARRAYYGAISYVDDHVGELLAILRTFGLTENTVMFFTADRGELLGERGLWYEMHLLERAARIPLVVHAPARFARRRVAVPGSLVDLLPTLVDLLPTLVDLLPTLVELGRPAATAGGLELQGDGQSLVPLRQGRQCAERPVFAEYLAEGALAPILMIRRGAQKFIWSEPDPPLLFDLDQDPDELDNLAEQPAHAERVQAFVAEVRERWAPQALYQAIVASQRTRRIAAEALAHGRRTPWGWTPAPHRGGYVSGDLDLSMLERRRRYPPPE